MLFTSFNRQLTQCMWHDAVLIQALPTSWALGKDARSLCPTQSSQHRGDLGTATAPTVELSYLREDTPWQCHTGDTRCDRVSSRLMCLPPPAGHGGRGTFPSSVAYCIITLHFHKGNCSICLCGFISQFCNCRAVPTTYVSLL